MSKATRSWNSPTVTRLAMTKDTKFFTSSKFMAPIDPLASTMNARSTGSRHSVLVVSVVEVVVVVIVVTIDDVVVVRFAVVVVVAVVVEVVVVVIVLVVAGVLVVVVVLLVAEMLVGVVVVAVVDEVLVAVFVVVDMVVLDVVVVKVVAVVVVAVVVVVVGAVVVVVDVAAVVVVEDVDAEVAVVRLPHSILKLLRNSSLDRKSKSAAVNRWSDTGSDGIARSSVLNVPFTVLAPAPIPSANTCPLVCSRNNCACSATNAVPS